MAHPSDFTEAPEEGNAIDLSHHTKEDEEKGVMVQPSLSRLEVIAHLAQAWEDLAFDSPMQEPVTQAAIAKVSIFHLHL